MANVKNKIIKKKITKNKIKPGLVRCGKVSRGVKHPQIDNFIKIGAYSRGPAEWRPLSPFLLGPIMINSDSDDLADDYHWTNCRYKKMRHCLIFENYWQGSKIYNIDVDVDVDVDEGQIKDSFFKRRERLFSLDVPKRRPVPKSKGDAVAGFYNGQIMDYIESRKRIYCPIYASLIENSPQFLKLKSMLKTGHNLLIVGPDGADLPMTYATMYRAVNDPNICFGHELVICCSLNGWAPWND